MIMVWNEKCTLKVGHFKGLKYIGVLISLICDLLCCNVVVFLNGCVCELNDMYLKFCVTSRSPLVSTGSTVSRDR